MRSTPAARIRPNSESRASGDIGAKLTYLTQHLGDPTLVVESGGRTAEGEILESYVMKKQDKSVALRFLKKPLKPPCPISASAKHSW